MRHHVVDRNAEGGQYAGSQCGGGYRKAGEVAVGRDQQDAGQSQQDAENLIGPRPAAGQKTGHDQNHDRRKILQDRGDAGAGKLDGQKVEILAAADTEQTVDQKIAPVIFILPRGKGELSVFAETVQE